MAGQVEHGSPKGMIFISRDRMAYGGPQVPVPNVLGGYVIHSSPERPFVLHSDDGCSEQTHLAIVPPYAKHSLHGGSNVKSILIEAESVSAEILDDDRFRKGGYRARVWAERIEAAFQRWQAGAYDVKRGSFDLFFFGERLPRRQLDKRIAVAADRIHLSPDAADSVTALLANELGVSPSRLRHLFCEEVGIPIRTFRAWKRARSAIQFAIQESNIINLAMVAGYADATHLSHSVKLYFGAQPKYVCAHWRGLQIIHTSRSENDAFAPPAKVAWSCPT